MAMAIVCPCLNTILIQKDVFFFLNIILYNLFAIPNSELLILIVIKQSLCVVQNRSADMPVCLCVCIPILVTTFPEWFSGTEPLSHTPGAVRPSSLCL